MFQVAYNCMLLLQTPWWLAILAGRFSWDSHCTSMLIRICPVLHQQFRATDAAVHSQLAVLQPV